MNRFVKFVQLIFFINVLAAVTPFNSEFSEYLEGFVTISSDNVEFGTVEVPETDLEVITLYNGGDDPLVLSAEEMSQSLFAITGIPDVVEPYSTVDITLSFSPVHNISSQEILALRFSGTDQDILISLSGAGDYSGYYYDSTANLWGEPLKDELQDIINPHTDLGYSGGRRAMYGYIDNENSSLECVYTGFTQYWPYGDDGTFPDPINCEHTWPQSFFNSNSPMRGDIFHLYPTHMDANSARGSYPFGDVVSGTNWSDGGSRRGNNSYGETVFEPRDEHKGDAARSIFYFITSYGNLGGYLGAHEEADLRGWYYEDPVSQKEIERNEAIYGYQNNRNPFIDHPEFLERISSFIGTAENQPDQQEAIWLSDGLSLSQVLQTYLFQIGNSGSSTFLLTDVTLAFNTFSAEIISNYILPGETGAVEISITGTEPGFYQDILTVHTSDDAIGSINIGLSATIWDLGDLNQDNAVDVLDVIIMVDVILNQPNPDDLIYFLSDIVPDNSVDILDVVGLVGIILN